MKIERINNYEDIRFKKDVLCQHGAYVIDNQYLCEFYIISIDSAIIYYHDYDNLDTLKEIINEFRFYSKNITKYYDDRNNLIIMFDEINIYSEKVANLQPSQFYIDETKLSQIKSWAKEKGNFVIPIMKHNNKNIILDGHTRLYLATILDIEEVFVYEDCSGDYIFDFVNEAEKRNIFTINSLKKVSQEEYKTLWHEYCDNYFNNKP